MRVVRLFSAALLVVAAVTVPVAAQAAPVAAPVAPYTAITLNSAADDLGRGHGGSWQYQGAAVEHRVDDQGAGVAAGNQADGSYIGVSFTFPYGTTPTSGTIPVTDFLDETHGEVFLTSNDNCLATDGTVTVLENTGTGDAAHFAADYEVTCDSRTYWGSMRYNSSIGFRAASLTPGVVDHGHLDIATSRTTTVTLTSAGSDPLVLGDVALDSDTPDSFVVTADTCSGATVAAGRSCAVTVRTAPQTAGVQHAYVRIPQPGHDAFEAAILLQATDPVLGTYFAATPSRVLDTRSGTGVRRGPIGAAQTLTFTPARNAPTRANAVVLNLTVDHPSTSGYLTLYPAGSARPRTSSINFTRAWTGANLVTVPLPADGRVAVFNSAGATAVIADVVGYYAAAAPAGSVQRGGGYHPTLVQRIFDSRAARFGKLKPGYYVDIPVRYQGDGQHIAALSVTVTAVNMTGTGYLTTWNGDYEAPRTSTLNYTRASGVVSNSAVVPAAYCVYLEPCNDNAYIAVLNQGATPVDVVVDINGFYDDGGLPASVRFHPLSAPTRIIDTRSKLGTSRFGANTTHTVTAPTSVAGVDTIALDANVTAVTPTARTYLTVWPKFSDYPRPQAAVLNPLRGQTVADHAVAEVGYGNLFNIYNFTGAVDLTMDVGGTFELFPPSPTGVATRAIPRAVAVPPANTTSAEPTVRHR